MNKLYDIMQLYISEIYKLLIRPYIRKCEINFLLICLFICTAVFRNTIVRLISDVLIIRLHEID